MLPRLILLSWLVADLIAGCTAATAAVNTLTPGVPAAAVTATLAMPAPVLVATREVATPLPTPAAPTLEQTLPPRLCSPLQGAPLDHISDLVSNPYHPPKPGTDDPHQGVDLAIRRAGSQVAVAGNPVQAALAGRVAMATRDRFPFGNAVIIETPLETLPETFWSAAGIPTPAPTLAPRSALTCPPGPAPAIADLTQRSLYVLYAHLQAPADLKPGDALTCGEVFGAVGMTGNALNPHLHFEVKVGPSGMRISSMSHYDAGATVDEMRNYCLWSVSGLFQLVDPMKILQPTP